MAVPTEVIRQVVDELRAGISDPLAQPRALAQKRVAQLKGLSAEARRRRLAAFLARRGFHGAEVRGVMEAVLREG